MEWRWSDSLLKADVVISAFGSVLSDPKVECLGAEMCYAIVCYFTAIMVSSFQGIVFLNIHFPSSSMECKKSWFERLKK